MAKKMRKIKPKRFPTLSDMEVAGPSKKERVIYPKLTLNLDNIPEAKDWKVGSKYKIVLEVKQTSISEGEEDYENRVEFDIMKIQAGDKSKKTDEEDY